MKKRREDPTDARSQTHDGLSIHFIRSLSFFLFFCLHVGEEEVVGCGSVYAILLACLLFCSVHGRHVFCSTNRHKRGKSRPIHVVQATLVGRPSSLLFFCLKELSLSLSHTFSLSPHKYLSPPFSLLFHSPFSILNLTLFPPIPRNHF